MIKMELQIQLLKENGKILGKKRSDKIDHTLSVFLNKKKEYECPEKDLLIIIN